MQLLSKSRFYLLALLISPLALAVSISAQGAVAPMQSKAPPQTEQSDPAALSTTLASSEETQQERIEADTKKLYQLALELRTEVGKTYKRSLSLAVLKKAEELEKLAKNLKSEMDHEASAKKP